MPKKANPRKGEFSIFVERSIQIISCASGS